MMGLREDIEALKARAVEAFLENDIDVEESEDGGESTEAPCVSLEWSLETGRWQASVALLAGECCDTPEDAVASLAEEMQ